MDPNQLKHHIDRVLSNEIPKYHSRDAVYQLLFTSAAESDCGKYIRQVKGPAMGLFQIEPNSEKLVWKWVIENNENLFEALVNSSTGSIFGGDDLIGNIKYQIILARAYYYSCPDALPNISDPIDKDSIKRMARYWKKYWNTEKGKGTVKGAVKKYKKFVGRKV
ncbi:MAG: hypothetical protein ACOCQD_03040 [archaeon]